MYDIIETFGIISNLLAFLLFGAFILGILNLFIRGIK